MQKVIEAVKNPLIAAMLVAAFILGAAVNAYAEDVPVGDVVEGGDLLAEAAPEAEVEDDGDDVGFFGRLARGTCEGITGAQYGAELDAREASLDEREAALNEQALSLDQRNLDAEKAEARASAATQSLAKLQAGIQAALSKVDGILNPAPEPTAEAN